MLRRFYYLCTALCFLTVLGCGDESSSNLSQLGTYTSGSDYYYDQTSINLNSFPLNTIGRVGSCTATLLSPRIALTSAHCLISRNLNIFDSSSRNLKFFISNTYLDVETVVLGTTNIPADPLAAERSNDWAFLVLEPGVISTSVRFMPLSIFSVKSFKADTVGMYDTTDELAYNQDVDFQYDDTKTFMFSNYVGSYGENSGVIIRDNARIVGLLTSDFESYDTTGYGTRTSTYVVNVAIPVTNSMLQTYYRINSKVASVTATAGDIQRSLSTLRFSDNTASTLVVVDTRDVRPIVITNPGVTFVPPPPPPPPMERRIITRNDLLGLIPLVVFDALAHSSRNPPPRPPMRFDIHGIPGINPSLPGGRPGSPIPVIDPTRRPVPTPRPDVRPTPAPRPDVRPTPAPRPDARPTPTPRPDVRPTPTRTPDVRPTPATRPSTPAARPTPTPTRTPDVRPTPASPRPSTPAARPAPVSPRPSTPAARPAPKGGPAGGPGPRH